MDRLFTVAVDAPISTPLTYLARSDFPSVDRGDSVKVPLGKRFVEAVVLGPTTEAGEFEIKAIQEKVEEKPSLPETYLSWLEWLAKYYMHPIGQVTKMAFPPLKKQTRAHKSKKSPVIPPTDPSQKLELTAEQ